MQKKKYKTDVNLYSMCWFGCSISQEPHEWRRMANIPWNWIHQYVNFRNVVSKYANMFQNLLQSESEKIRCIQICYILHTLYPNVLRQFNEWMRKANIPWNRTLSPSLSTLLCSDLQNGREINRMWLWPITLLYNSQFITSEGLSYLIEIYD